LSTPKQLVDAISDAEIKAAAEEAAWTPTGRLRWVKVVAGTPNWVSRIVGGKDYVLQQHFWNMETDAQEWRDVPKVREGEP
jgi:hypothetical protein